MEKSRIEKIVDAAIKYSPWMNKYVTYTHIKKHLDKTGLNAEQYEHGIKYAVDRLGI